MFIKNVTLLAINNNIIIHIQHTSNVAVIGMIWDSSYEQNYKKQGE